MYVVQREYGSCKKKFVLLLQLTRMYRGKVLILCHFQKTSCGAWSKSVSEKWKSKHSHSPKNCFLTYLETEKVMFIVFEWKELGVYDVRYNNVRQSSHKKMPRERGSRKKEGTNRTKKSMFSLVTAPVTLRDPQTKVNDVFWWITYFLWFAQITNFSSLRQRSNTQKEEDCYESWELIWGIFPAALAPVLRF